MTTEERWEQERVARAEEIKRLRSDVVAVNTALQIGLLQELSEEPGTDIWIGPPKRVEEESVFISPNVFSDIGSQIRDAENARKCVEPGELGEAIGALFGGLSDLSK